jgi:hypothetical protein
VVERLAAAPVPLRVGRWRGHHRIYWRNREALRRITQIFLGFYGASAPHVRWRRRILNGILQWFVHPVVRSSATRSGATVVWMARDGSMKCFDFERMEVATTVSADVRRRLEMARELPLFKFFTTPKFEIEARDDGVFIQREPLYEAPCIGLRTRNEQREAVREIANTYAAYARAASRAPDPARFLACFDEVLGCLAAPARAVLEPRRVAFTAFVTQVRVVESHLDFNVANFLGGAGRPLVLLDIADAGLWLPVTYDLNNLLLTEVGAGRSPHLLHTALETPGELGYEALMQASSDCFDLRDVKSSLLVNFVLRHSAAVSERLTGGRTPGQVRRSWERFAAQVPGWPIVDA